MNDMSKSGITIYHNPACGTSRSVLALLREAGHEPRIVEYLRTPLDAAGLRALQIPARELLRAKEPLCETLQLNEDRWSDRELFDFMAAHPVLMNRPVVVSPRGTRLCRPAERVNELL